jgi:hypothetical protein
MAVVSRELKKAFAVLVVSSTFYISCNDRKPDEKAPAFPEQEVPEKMPMQKLDTNNSEMPVVSPPDSTASMPNGYQPESIPKKQP